MLKQRTDDKYIGLVTQQDKLFQVREDELGFPC